MDNLCNGNLREMKQLTKRKGEKRQRGGGGEVGKKKKEKGERKENEG